MQPACGLAILNMERFSSSLVLCHALVLLLCLAAAAAAGPLSVMPGSVVNDVVEFHAQWTGNPAINSVELPPPGAWAVVSLVQDPPVEVGVGPGATNVAWTVTVSHINGPHAEDVDPNYPLVLRCPPTVGIDYTSPANGGINVKSFTHMTTSPPPYHVDTLQLECRYDWASNTLTITLSTLHHYGDPHLLVSQHLSTSFTTSGLHNGVLGILGYILHWIRRPSKDVTRSYTVWVTDNAMA